MRITSSVALMVLLTTCSHSKMQVVMLGPAGAVVDTVPPEMVYVFTGEHRVLPEFRPIAKLSVGPKYWTNPGWEVSAVEWALREQAGGLGADAVILGDVSGWPYPGPEGEDTWGTATAIRFADPVEGRPVSAARSTAALKALVVAPLAAPEDLSVPDSIAEAFVQSICDELGGAGFTVLPMGLFESVWEDLSREPGEQPDPSAAFKGLEPTQTLENRTLRILVEEHGADGFVFPDIQVVEARFHGEQAEWDGVSQRVGNTRSTGAKIVSGLINLFRTGEQDWSEEDTTPDGRVQAMSLVVQIENAIGARLYAGRGGIQLLEKADFEGGIWIGDPEPEGWEAVEVPAENLFKKQDRVWRAVRVALEPLLGGGALPR